jgi:hypothetical protein
LNFLTRIVGILASEDSCAKLLHVERLFSYLLTKISLISSLPWARLPISPCFHQQFMISADIFTPSNLRHCKPVIYYVLVIWFWVKFCLTCQHFLLLNHQNYMVSKDGIFFFLIYCILKEVCKMMQWIVVLVDLIIPHLCIY